MKQIFPGIALIFAIFSSVKAEQSDWLQLFNGKDLSGWKAIENPSRFKVENGLLVCSEARGRLEYCIKMIGECGLAPDGIFYS